jgi:hypothetical protein
MRTTRRFGSKTQPNVVFEFLLERRVWDVSVSSLRLKTAHPDSPSFP